MRIAWRTVSTAGFAASLALGARSARVVLSRLSAMAIPVIGSNVLSALVGCAQIDASRLAQLSDALDAAHARTIDTHARVRKLQDVVYRTKVSLAPKLDAESLARPEWLDTNAQFLVRERALEAMRAFATDLRSLAGATSTQSTQLHMRQLLDGGESVAQKGRDVLAAASVLKPIQPIFSGLVGGLFPQVGLVSVALAGPMLEYAKRSDLRTVMRAGQPAFNARAQSLAPGGEVLAEYVMALKSEYLPDASALRDQLSGGDRMRFDQNVIDLLAEFDALSRQAASLSGALKMVERAYAETMQGLR